MQTLVQGASRTSLNPRWFVPVSGLVPAFGLGVRERVGEAHALNGPLLRAVDRRWLRQPGDLQNRRCNVDMVELLAQLAFGRDALGPVNGHPVAGAAEAGGQTCFVQVKGESPATAQPAA